MSAVDVLAVNPTTEDSSVVPAIPRGMVQVSRDDFWRAVMSERRDVMPSPQRLHTDWLFNGTRNQWGWVSQGFASPHGVTPAYALARATGAQS